MKDMTILIKNKAKEFGADLAGIAPVSRWQNAPRMLTPQAHLPEAKSVIVMGIHHPDASVEWGGEPNSNYAGPFQIGMIPKLDTMSCRMADFLEQSGYKAIPFPCTGFWRHRPFKEISTTNTASFSHRHAAVAAGLGEFGWNNMFMSPKYGPRQRLVSVITSAALEADPLYDGPALCDRCKMCAKHCPGHNFRSDLLLESGEDKVIIEDKIYKYAKLNRWRCLWGEQFALDMDQLGRHEKVNEETLYQAVRDGVRRVGGEFGSCLRFCMARDIRYWDRKYTRAPRRKKAQVSVSTQELLEKIKTMALVNGIDRLVIRPLSEFNKAEINLPAGYPADGLFKNFAWLISIGRKMPLYRVLDDNAEYLSATTKVRLSIGAYDIAAYLDDLGFEAMQDWTPLSALAQARAGWDDMTVDADNAKVVAPAGAESLPRTIRYAVSARGETGVQREQQSMTAGAQNGMAGISRMIFCGVICRAPLAARTELLNVVNATKADLLSPSCLRGVDKAGVARVDNLPKIPGVLDFSAVLPGARSLIVLLAGFSKRTVELAANQDSEDATTYSFLQYQTLRELLWTAHDLSARLEAEGHRALPLADCTLNSFRTISPYWEFEWAKLGHPDPRANAPLAVAAGLGQLGRSGLLLTPEFGPRHKFVFVLTTAELPIRISGNSAALCLRCGKCAEACPVKALNKDTLENIAGCEVFVRNEVRCRWARSLGMIPEEGQKCLGWKTPGIPVPDEISEDKIQEYLSQKDPLQVTGYRAPCHTDTIVEKCLQVCPVGK
ncbi:MAG: 4Fe-4S dicluster domain-containing protein [Verrucomicrobia bacterium]|nr:4Fe-4S dicluster domain-containing protein [Verrucomicrobiota bacterium]MBU1735002.1 4Fe-4S dicluster domain-containing protein [Verrucomicrobiota bacterium]MBU1856275.1 4Fe-4S dicluster domain-containing protein [Verrucomicrobiota bacterium]